MQADQMGDRADSFLNSIANTNGDDRSRQRSSRHDDSSRRPRSRSPYSREDDRSHRDRDYRSSRGGDEYRSRRRDDDYGRRDDYGRPPPPPRRDDYGGGGGAYDRGYGGGRGGYDRGYGGGGGGAYGRDDRRGPPGGGGGFNGGGPAGPPGRGRGRNQRVFEGFMDHGRRSPSPDPATVIPISQRKRQFTAWDVKPEGFENYTTEQAKMTGLFNLPGQSRPPISGSMMPPPGMGSVPGMPNMAPPLHFRGGVPGVPGLGPGAPLGSFARQSRRLYVGNITPDGTEENIAHFFNQKMAEMNLLSDKGLGEDLQGLGLKGDQPVISVHLNYEKNYAFVEFRNGDEATNAMGFDGIVFQNNALKIRRPKDYIDPLGDGQAPHVPGVVSTNVPDTPNKIFIGGLPSYLNDDQVMELLKSFGELRSFNLVKEGGSGASKGFAFCEYVDPAVTEVACQGLNGMELGERYLVVQRAALGASASRGLPGQPMHFPGGPMNASMAHAEMAAAAMGEGQPTRVLQILNMVAIEELTNDEDYKEIIEDIKEECGKFGQVEEVKIPRPVTFENGKIDAKASEAVKDLGKVFVLFDKEEQTTAALRAIAGRQFGGRLCICAYAPLDVFVEDL